ncbi:FliH/SctL family protein [Haliovirga abyssi]|uniref:Flagellar assembly protein FliH/Type III secretion system HrpE domain-containing protein n=1 Tax=Haliovirga abyssi TaxID=2996794 RepID=A0AAU9DGB6_9FUSO|nr:FliH/SctL family protein [Haliovirga abyssi]BDU50482.1 hypothetical protein HLVA_10510 [Haliovirga abyssi]
MFNVIKGEFIQNNSKPIIIGDKCEQKNIKNYGIEELDNKKEELETLNKNIKEKELELKNLSEKIERKKIELNEKVNKIIEEANQKAEYELEVNKNRGYQDGYQAGEKSAKEEIIEQTKSLIIRAQGIIDETVEIRNNTIKENEEAIIKLSIEIAKKIIKLEVSENNKIIKNNILESIKKVPISKKLKIFINWEDLNYLKDIKEEVISQINGVDRQEIEMIEDSRIEKGGCILETSMGTIDASINSQLEVLFEGLMKVKD